MEQRSMPIYTFGEALEFLLNGKKVARSRWSLKRHVICRDSKDLFIKCYGKYKLWRVTQEDILAKDWLVIEDV